MEIKVSDIILSTLNLELTLKHIKDLCTFFCQIWICIETGNIVVGGESNLVCLDLLET